MEWSHKNFTLLNVGRVPKRKKAIAMKGSNHLNLNDPSILLRGRSERGGVCKTGNSLSGSLGFKAKEEEKRVGVARLSDFDDLGTSCRHDGSG